MKHDASAEMPVDLQWWRRRRIVRRRGTRSRRAWTTGAAIARAAVARALLKLASDRRVAHEQ